MHINSSPSAELIQKFIDNAGSANDTFRYFKNRSLDCMHNHIITLLLIDENDMPIGYGHIDLEDETNWLGISISENSQGHGFGMTIMTELIKLAREKQLQFIQLSVDKANKKAVNLYEKVGFKFKKDFNDKVQLMEIKL